MNKGIDIPRTPAGLQKTRKLIRTEKDREIQFLKLCALINFENTRQERSEKQRNERRMKRKLFAFTAESMSVTSSENTDENVFLEKIL